MDEDSTLVSFPSCKFESTKQFIEHKEYQRLMQFLMGLKESYSALRFQIFIDGSITISIMLTQY